MWPTAPPCFTLIIQLVPHPTRNKFLTDSAPWHHWCLNCLLVVNVALGYNASARKRKKYSQSFPYLWQGTSDNLASAKFIMNGNTSPCPKLTVRESNYFVNNKTKVVEELSGSGSLPTQNVSILSTDAAWHTEFLQHFSLYSRLQHLRFLYNLLTTLQRFGAGNWCLQVLFCWWDIRHTWWPMWVREFLLYLPIRTGLWIKPWFPFPKASISVHGRPIVEGH